MDGAEQFSYHAKSERILYLKRFLRLRYKNFSELRVLEIGAGVGGNLAMLNELGIAWEHITANEIQQDRILKLRSNFPKVNILEGNAKNLNENLMYDIVIQSLVFTSILDKDDRVVVAEQMWNSLKSGGCLLWYDFTFNNPSNQGVKKVSLKEVKTLFPMASSYLFKRVTLAPPIGRRVGNYYSLVNSLFPFLRTHLVALISK